MLRKCLRCALCAVVALAAAGGRAAITQEGGVVITPTNIEVGNSNVGDGTLRVTAPSTLSAATLYAARNLPTLHGRVFVEGGAVAISQTAAIGEVGVGELHVSEGGLFDAGILSIGGLAGNGTMAAGTVGVAGAGSKVVTRNRLLIGDFGVGELNASDGALVQSVLSTSQLQAIIANNTGSLGAATVTGPATAWEHGGTLTVGNGGVGSLLVADGATMTSGPATVGGGLESNAAGVGTVVVDGPGSRWATSALTIGGRGMGEVRVTGGGVLDAAASKTEFVTLGAQNGSFGRLIISGPDSRWNDTATVNIGQSGAGEVWIDGGALVNSGIVRLGSSSNGTGLARVSGPGTRWQTTSLTVGGTSTSRGTLEISDGATVAFSQTTSGPTTVGALGRIVLDGGQLTGGFNTSLTNSGIIEGDGVVAVRATNLGTGQILVGEGDRLQFPSGLSSGGRIEVFGGELEASAETSSNGTILADDATLRFRGNSGLINIGPLRFVGGENRVFGPVTNRGSNASIAATGGSRTTFFDNVFSSATMSVSVGSQMTFLGALQANSIGGAGEVFLEGPVQPNANPGGMTFGNDVHFGGGSRLEIDVRGLAPGTEFDQVVAEGDVHLDGALQLVARAALPVNGTATLPIVRAGELFGTFSSVPEIGAQLGFGLLFHGIQYDYNHDEVLVTFLQGPAGDFNADGAADGADLMLWQQSLGMPCVPGVGADANCDGVVDAGDLALWNASVAAAAGAQATAQTAVPEPASLGLLFVAFVGLVGGIRRPGARGRF